MKIIGIVLIFFTLIQDSVAGVPEDVRRIMHNSQNWYPKDYTRNLKAIEAIGITAVPTLLDILSEAEHKYAIGHACEALERVPSAASIPHMEPFLQHPDWYIRSSCGAALAMIHSAVQSGEAAIIDVFSVMTNDSNCSVRKNIATELSGTRSPMIKNWSMVMLQEKKLDICDTSVALYALTAFPVEEQVGQIIISILEDSSNPAELRENAAYTLTKYHYFPAKEALREILSGQNPGRNVFAQSLRALGEIGDSSDIAVIQKVIEQDPYSGQGVWSVNGKEAIQKIQKSGR